MIINPYVFAVAGGSDPYFANVSLLITGIGVDEDTVIVDSSSYAHTVTVVSGTKYENTGPPTGQSTFVYMGISGMSVADHTSLDMGSGDFTLETYFREDTFGVAPILIAKGATPTIAPYIMYCVVGTHSCSTYASNDGATYPVAMSSATNSYVAGTWTHLAFCRSGTNFYMWIDGASGASAGSMSGALSTTSEPLHIGYWGGTNNRMAGGVAGLRITKGVARYTSTFTPPTLPLPTS